MGHPPPPSPRSGGWKAFSKPMSCSRRLKGGFGEKPAVQSSEGPELLRFTGSSNAEVENPDGVLTIASRWSLMTPYCIAKPAMYWGRGRGGDLASILLNAAGLARPWVS